MADEPAISISTSPVRLSIEIGGVPHILARRRTLFLVQGYIALRNVPDGEVYIVEFTNDKGATTRAEYDTREKWQTVLCGLRDSNLFGDFENG